LEQIIGKLPPDDCGILGDGFGCDQPIQTCHQRIVERGRNRERGERPYECVVPIDGGELSRFQNSLGDFFHKERHAIRLGNDLLQHLWWEGFAIGHACDNLFHLRV
jgi:hypothetical protein